MPQDAELAARDIQAWLEQHMRKGLLRLLTCGSVDDGKSTLIGRLLHDSQQIYEDQIVALANDSRSSGCVSGELDLALLVDGLQAEREQNITIDVAYRYFSTTKRKFIIADTPGHERYTRNMATGASTCDLAIILIDAMRGIQTQTTRHSVIAQLLGIRHILVAVNKMDLVKYDEATFARLRDDYQSIADKLKLQDVRYLPLSALKGDNVVEPSENMPWYSGETLLQMLENIDIADDRNLDKLRFPVQYVNRPDTDFRGYCGTLSAGAVRRGDTVKVLPSREESRVRRILGPDGELDEAFTPMALDLVLEDDIDISRGDLIIHGDDDLPQYASEISAMVIWMTEQALRRNRPYYLKFPCRTVSGRLAQIDFKLDPNTLQTHDTTALRLNDIARCTFCLDTEMYFDPYPVCKDTGSFIIIDRLNNITVGAGMIEQASTRGPGQGVVPTLEHTLWLQGALALPVAQRLEQTLCHNGHLCVLLELQTGARRPDLDTLEMLNRAGLAVLVAAGDEHKTPDKLPKTVVRHSCDETTATKTPQAAQNDESVEHCAREALTKCPGWAQLELTP